MTTSLVDTPNRKTEIARMVCNKCKAEKPQDAFGWSKKRGKLYLRKICKACDAAYDAARRSDPVIKAAIAAQSKAHRSKPDVKARMAAYDKAKYGANPEKYRQDAKDSKNRNWATRLMSHIRISYARGTKRKKVLLLPVEIGKTDIERYWETQNGLCYFTGVPMRKETHSLFSVSVDRLDCKLGYVPGNVVLTCKATNLARNTASEAEFCEWLKAVTQHY